MCCYHEWKCILRAHYLWDELVRKLSYRYCSIECTSGSAWLFNVDVRILRLLSWCFKLFGAKTKIFIYASTSMVCTEGLETIATSCLNCSTLSLTLEFFCVSLQFQPSTQYVNKVRFLFHFSVDFYIRQLNSTSISGGNHSLWKHSPASPLTPPWQVDDAGCLGDAFTPSTSTCPFVT